MRHRLLKSLALFVLIAGAAVLIAWRLTWANPSWYRPADARDVGAQRLAEAVENRIIEESHKVRALDAPWTLRVRSEQVNAWLSSRLPRWLVHEQDVQWPEQLGTPQVRLTSNGLDLALLLSPQQRPRTIVLRVLPSITDGRLFLAFDRVSVGRIPMPNYALDDLVAFAAEHGAEQVMQQPEVLWLLELLAGRESIDPVTSLADDRRVRLLDLRLDDDFIDLTMQTLPPQQHDE